MIVYEQLRYLVMGGKSNYLHGKLENKKTTELQDFLDMVYQKNPSYYKKFH